MHNFSPLGDQPSRFTPEEAQAIAKEFLAIADDERFANEFGEWVRDDIERSIHLSEALAVKVNDHPLSQRLSRVSMVRRKLIELPLLTRYDRLTPYDQMTLCHLSQLEQHSRWLVGMGELAELPPEVHELRELTLKVYQGYLNRLKARDES